MGKLVAMFVLAGSIVFAQQTRHAAAPAPNDAALPKAADAAMQRIDAERIRAHVKFLSSDLLEGRGTGQRGGSIAAEYMATQFEQYGLKPAGEKGTYFQNVPLVGVTLEDQQTSFVLQPASGAPMKLAYKDDYVATDQTLNERDEIDAPIVFMGYGITAPEYNWDDYKSVDVRGKVLLMLVNEPPSNDPRFFTGRALTYYGRWVYKYEEAARHGAVACILIHKTEMASYGWEVVRNSWSGEVDSLRDNLPKLKAAGWVQLEIARKLAEASGKDLDQLMQDATRRDFHPVPLDATLKASLVSKVHPIHAVNVLAKLEGSDARLKQQALMYSAHYDHLGIKPDMPDDNIFNGAADNATGCGILLELARAYASAAARPKRSVIFAAVTAEEQGLLGSKYLGMNPPLPARNITLDLNFDDVSPLGVPEEVQVSGAERTSFWPVVQQTAKAFHLDIVPDSHPEAGHYYRSDHFSFARVGIPSFSVNEGTKFAGHTREWGLQQSEDYTAHRYHQPSDEYRPDMDFRGDARVAQFGFDLGWRAATTPELLGWKPGDEFEKNRK
jgi:Zn-dependent M28 family amino/carboxypeptidase